MDYFKVLSEDVSAFILSQNIQENKSNLPRNRMKNSQNIVRNFLKSTQKYIDLLKIINFRCKKEKKYIASLQKRLNSATNEFAVTANLVESRLPLNRRKHIRELLRKNVEKYIFQSQLLKRFYKKPLGYAGDYFMFEMIYNENPISKGIGYYFDKNVLEYALIQAVINRKNKMKQFLREAIRSSDESIFRILNIGCGSCREIRELLSEEINFYKKIKFILVDQDYEGLEFVRNNIQSRWDNIKLNFVQNDILTLLGFAGDKNLNNLFPYKMDLIYSVGLVDYFLDSTFDLFLRKYFQLLKRGGKLIIASCSNKRPFCYAPLRWFCEWSFYFRNPNLTKKRIEKILNASSVKIEWEQNKQIFFLVIKK